MNTGNTAFMMICTALVFFMTPGLAFFYGGLVRRKNVCNTMMACVAIMGLSVLLWTMFGYSLSFGGNHAGIIGDFHWAFLNDVGWEAGPYADTIPHLVFAAFQMMFAMITPALITGAVVGRMRFKALFAFIALWSFLVYYPMAHMVWGEGGFLAAIGSVDFAGGNVVHISSGVSALVLATYLGRKKGYEKTSYRIHNIPFVVLGASLKRTDTLVEKSSRMSENSGTFFRFKIEVLLLSLSMPPSSALLCTWDTAVLRQHLLSVRLSHTHCQHLSPVSQTVMWLIPL